MKGKQVLYMGRYVCSENFRTYIYCPGGTKKLVESWKEYQDHIGSGAWFATGEEAEECAKARSQKPKRSRSASKDKVGAAVEMIEAQEGQQEIVDDFLPN